MGFTRNLLATFIVTVTEFVVVVTLVVASGAYKTICAQSKLGSLNDLRLILLTLFMPH